MNYKDLKFERVFGKKYTREDINLLAEDLNEVLGLYPPIDINETDECIYVESVVYACSKVNHLDSLTRTSWKIIEKCGLADELEISPYKRKFKREKDIVEKPATKDFLELVDENRKFVEVISFKPRHIKHTKENKLQQIYYDFVLEHAKSGFTFDDVFTMHTQHFPNSVTVVKKYLNNFLTKALPNIYGGGCISKNGKMYVILPQIQLTNKELEELFSCESKPKKDVRGPYKTKPRNKKPKN